MKCFQALFQFALLFYAFTAKLLHLIIYTICLFFFILLMKKGRKYNFRYHYFYLLNMNSYKHIFHSYLSGLNSIFKVLTYLYCAFCTLNCFIILISAGDGSFLVRPSEHYPGDYSLFFLSDKTVIRFRIEKQGRQLFIGGRYFDRLVTTLPLHYFHLPT